MMRGRIYKFRAIKIGSTVPNQFVYGSLVQNPNETLIIDADGFAHPVAPMTVGQFTGCLGKDRVEIYEGDRILGRTVVDDVYDTEPEHPFTIEWKHGSFCSDCGQWDDGQHNWHSIEHCETRDWEVIGNTVVM